LAVVVVFVVFVPAAGVVVGIITITGAVVAAAAVGADAGGATTGAAAGTLFVGSSGARAGAMLIAASVVMNNKEVDAAHSQNTTRRWEGAAINIIIETTVSGFFGPTLGVKMRIRDTPIINSIGTRIRISEQGSRLLTLIQECHDRGWRMGTTKPSQSIHCQKRIIMMMMMMLIASPFFLLGLIPTLACGAMLLKPFVLANRSDGWHLQDVVVVVVADLFEMMLLLLLLLLLLLHF
jgi:hypothetical protein